MAFSEYAAQYHTLYTAWTELASQEVDPLLEELRSQGLVNGIRQMNALAPMVTQEFADIAEENQDQRARLMTDLDRLAELTLDSGLLDPFAIGQARATIETTYPEASQEERAFAHAFLFGHTVQGLLAQGLPLLPHPKNDVAPTDVLPTPDHEPVTLPPLPSPEYKGQTALLTHREAFFLISTLIGRGERIDLMRENGIAIPDNDFLEEVWRDLRMTLPAQERTEVTALFTRQGLSYHDAVQTERQQAAQHLLDIIRHGELSDQFDYFMNLPGELDPRCHILDFLDGVDIGQHPYLEELLQRVVDRMVPVHSISGRVLEHMLIPVEDTNATAESLDPEVEASTLPPLAAEEELFDPLASTFNEHELRLLEEAVATATGDVAGLYSQYGLDKGETITSSDLLRFPTVSYNLVTEAKNINGLLTACARKSRGKARFSVEDIVALAVYSAYPVMFDGLSDKPLRELMQEHNTKPRQLLQLVRATLAKQVDPTAA